MRTLSNEPSPPDPAFHADRQHILIADDDETIRNLLDTTLSREGYQVACTKDGEEAWAQLKAGKTDLLITDHDMPRLKGLDLLRRLRLHSLRLPVILISGYMPWAELDQDSLEPLIPMCKPFSLALLRTRVRELLQARIPIGEAQPVPLGLLHLGQLP